jgi:UDP-N-acetylglucosamine 2-epimerase
MRYAWNAADVVVAVSEEVKKELLEAGVNEQRVLVIGEKDVFEVSDRVMDQYYELYSRLSAK